MSWLIFIIVASIIGGAFSSTFDLNRFQNNYQLIRNYSIARIPNFDGVTLKKYAERHIPLLFQSFKHYDHDHEIEQFASRWSSPLNYMSDWSEVDSILQLRPQEHLDASEVTAPVFFIHNEADHGGFIEATLDHISRPTVLPPIRLQSLLAVTDGQQHLPPDTKLLFSTDFRELAAASNSPVDRELWRLFKAEDASDPSRQNITAIDVAPAWWLMAGGGGSALQTRYSEYHTVRLQLSGACRHVMFPPEQAKNLYLFPSIHPSSKQSQVDVYAYAELQEQGLYSKFKNAGYIEATLSGGEALYIPPYWHVLTEEVSETGISVAVDVLTPSVTQVLLLDAHLTALPIRNVDLSKKQQRVIASMIYLVHVLSRLKGFVSPLKFSRALYKTRFEALYPETSLFMQRNALAGGFACYRELPEVHQQVVDSIDKIYLIEGAEAVAKKVNSKTVPQAVRWIWAGDYVEQIARWAMGDPNEAVLFIRECLSQETGIEVVVEVEGPSVMKMDPKE